MATELKDLQKNLTKLVDDIQGKRLDFSLAAAKDAEGLVKARIFNVSGAKDVEGQSLGGYKSKSQRRRRERRGAQTDKKDLIISGETLRDSIITGFDTSLGEATVDFTTQEAATISEGLEAQGNVTGGNPDREIFSLSDDEVDQVDANSVDLIIEEVESAIKKIFG